MRIPEFSIIDENRLNIDNSYLSGNNVYIQFINPMMAHERILLQSTYNKWKNRIQIVAIYENTIEKNKYLNEMSINIIDGSIHENENVYMKFGLKKNEGYYFVFDKNGDLVTSGKSDKGYENGPKIFIEELIENKIFSIGEILPVDHKVTEIKWLSQISSIIKNSKGYKYYLFALFNEVCDTCSGGPIIGLLKDIYKNVNKYIYVTSILNNKYSYNDAKIMKSQLRINYPIIIGDEQMCIKWNELIDKYNADIMSDIVFITDDSGNVLKVSHKKCNCYASFVNEVNSIIKIMEGN